MVGLQGEFEFKAIRKCQVEQKSTSGFSELEKNNSFYTVQRESKIKYNCQKFAKYSYKHTITNVRNMFF